jgi:hypothetical protein
MYGAADSVARASSGYQNEKEEIDLLADCMHSSIRILAYNYPQFFDLLPEQPHPAARVRDVIEFHRTIRTFDHFTGLDQTPDGPHAMRSRTPYGDLTIQKFHFLQTLLVGRCSPGCRRSALKDRHVLQVNRVEITALLTRWIQFRVENMRSGRVVIARPFQEVIGDVKCGWIERGILEIDNDDLRLLVRTGSRSKLSNARTWRCSGLPCLKFVSLSRLPYCASL